MGNTHSCIGRDKKMHRLTYIIICIQMCQIKIDRWLLLILSPFVGELEYYLSVFVMVAESWTDIMARKRRLSRCGVSRDQQQNIGSHSPAVPKEVSGMLRIKWLDYKCALKHRSVQPSTTMLIAWQTQFKVCTQTHKSYSRILSNSQRKSILQSPCWRPMLLVAWCLIAIYLLHHTWPVSILWKLSSNLENQSLVCKCCHFFLTESFQEAKGNRSACDVPPETAVFVRGNPALRACVQSAEAGTDQENYNQL